LRVFLSFFLSFLSSSSSYYDYYSSYYFSYYYYFTPSCTLEPSKNDLEEIKEIWAHF